MSQLRKLLNTVLDALAGVSFLVMVVLTCWQVFTRYVLNDPATWTEELVAYMFGWMSLFGAALVVGERGHMNIPLLVDKMGPSGKKILNIIAEVIACIFAVVILIYGGFEITSLAMGQTTSSLGVQVGVFYVVMPIAGVLIVIYTILNILGILNGSISLEVVDEATQALEKVEKEAQQ